MSDNLARFLVDLATNQDLMESFLEDPQAVLSGIDLTADERDALLSRDGNAVYAVLRGPVSIGNVNNVSIGNVNNVFLGNVQNLALGGAALRAAPVRPKRSRKKAAARKRKASRKRRK
jgi:autotransporter adhesin